MRFIYFSQSSSEEQKYFTSNRGGSKGRGRAMGAIAPSPLAHYFHFSVIVTKKSNRGPLKIK